MELIETKKCNICTLDKSLSEFFWETKKGVKKYRAVCKPCEKIKYSDLWNKRLLTGETIKCCNCDLEKDINSYSQKNQTRCSDCNTIFLRLGQKRYSLEFREKHGKNRKNDYNKERRLNDPSYRVKLNLRTYLSKLVKKQKGKAKYFGCPFEFLIKWLEFNFDKYMTMNNYGIYWHIDHVIPCSSFDFTNDFDTAKCFNWTNLRPLKGIENCSRKDNVTTKELLDQKIQVNHFITSIIILDNDSIKTSKTLVEQELIIIKSTLNFLVLIQ